MDEDVTVSPGFLSSLSSRRSLITTMRDTLDPSQLSRLLNTPQSTVQKECKGSSKEEITCDFKFRMSGGDHNRRVSYLGRLVNTPQSTIKEEEGADTMEDKCDYESDSKRISKMNNRRMSHLISSASTPIKEQEGWISNGEMDDSMIGRSGKESNGRFRKSSESQLSQSLSAPLKEEEEITGSTLGMSWGKSNTLVSSSLKDCGTILTPTSEMGRTGGMATRLSRGRGEPTSPLAELEDSKLSRMAMRLTRGSNPTSLFRVGSCMIGVADETVSVHASSSPASPMKRPLKMITRKAATLECQILPSPPPPQQQCTAVVIVVARKSALKATVSSSAKKSVSFGQDRSLAFFKEKPVTSLTPSLEKRASKRRTTMGDENDKKRNKTEKRKTMGDILEEYEAFDSPTTTTTAIGAGMFDQPDSGEKFVQELNFTSTEEEENYETNEQDLYTDDLVSVSAYRSSYTKNRRATMEVPNLKDLMMQERRNRTSLAGSVAMSSSPYSAGSSSSLRRQTMDIPSLRDLLDDSPGLSASSMSSLDSSARESRFSRRRQTMDAPSLTDFLSASKNRRDTLDPPSLSDLMYSEPTLTMNRIEEEVGEEEVVVDEEQQPFVCGDDDRENHNGCGGDDDRTMNIPSLADLIDKEEEEKDDDQHNDEYEYKQGDKFQRSPANITRDSTMDILPLRDLLEDSVEPTLNIPSLDGLLQYEESPIKVAAVVAAASPASPDYDAAAAAHTVGDAILLHYGPSLLKEDESSFAAITRSPRSPHAQNPLQAVNKLSDFLSKSLGAVTGEDVAEANSWGPNIKALDFSQEQLLKVVQGRVAVARKSLQDVLPLSKRAKTQATEISSKCAALEAEAELDQWMSKVEKFRLDALTSAYERAEEDMKSVRDINARLNETLQTTEKQIQNAEAINEAQDVVVELQSKQKNVQYHVDALKLKLTRVREQVTKRVEDFTMLEQQAQLELGSVRQEKLVPLDVFERQVLDLELKLTLQESLCNWKLKSATSSSAEIAFMEAEGSTATGFSLDVQLDYNPIGETIARMGVLYGNPKPFVHELLNHKSECKVSDLCHVLAMIDQYYAEVS